MEKDEQTREFIRKAREVHGDRYDYSKVEYINSIMNVIIICIKHGEFLQRPNNHLQRKGCVNCIDRTKRRSNIEEFIKKAKDIHGDTYDYSKYNYVNSHTKGIIICKTHGEFTQHAGNHLQGKGCDYCGTERTANIRRKPFDKFIQQSKNIHGDTYDYSKVSYINSNTKVTIICKTHGEFQQTPAKHNLAKQGCPICGGSYKSNTEEFITKAKEIHGDIYDYSKVEYINNKTNVIIICKKHGEFQQTPHKHLSKSGCNYCGTDHTAEIRRKPISEFIEESKNTHGDKYDYSKVEYINGNTKVIIICKKHGEFPQTPNSHIQGNGCSKCAGQYVPSTEEYIEKAKEIHGDNYDYSKVNYTKAKDKIIITCKIHGDFETEAYHHSTGVGCSKCAGKYSPNTEEYIEKAIQKHGNKYDYSNVEYINGKTNIIIICKKHGEFSQNAQSHLCGHGCPICVNKTEAKLYEKLITIYSTLQTQFKQDWCKKQLCLPFDFCIPEYKIIIELDGEQHFRQVRDWKSPEEQQENDKYKEECANQNGYSVIRLLQEDVYNDTYDWVKELCEAIEQIKSSEGIKNRRLCKNGEYENY